MGCTMLLAMERTWWESSFLMSPYQSRTLLQHLERTVVRPAKSLERPSPGGVACTAEDEIAGTVGGMTAGELPPGFFTGSPHILA